MKKFKFYNLFNLLKYTKNISIMDCTKNSFNNNTWEKTENYNIISLNNEKLQKYNSKNNINILI